MALFLEDWAVSDPLEEMASDFQINIKELEKLNIIVATYTYENYSGDAFVLFEQGGKFYEVNGSHCSCYGLEGQWQPEEVDIDELENRFTLKHGQNYCEGYYQSYSCGLVDVYASEVLEAIKEIRELQQEDINQLT